MSATSGDEESGLAQLVRLSRLSGTTSVAKVQPDTVVTMQVRVTRPIVRPLPLTRLAAFEAAPRASAARYNRSARSARPRSVRVLATTLGVISMLFIAGIAGIGAYHHWVRPSHHVATDQALIVHHLELHAVLLSTSSSAITYQVPVGSYSIAVAVAHPCWIVVKSPPGAAASQVAVTLLPSSSPMLIPIRGSASITFAAQVMAVTILSGSKVLAVINDPALGPAYTFVPSTA